jgi:ComF family protein
VKLLRHAVNLLFPARCIFCRKYLPPDSTKMYCESCRLYIESFSSHEKPIPKGVCLYSLDYAADVRRAILAFKFRHRPQYAVPFGQILAPIAAKLHADAITYAPVSALRLTQRGYDQSRLLAKAVGRELGIPVVRALYKRRHNRRQSRLDHNARAANVQDVYAARVSAELYGRRVILIDDVVTTGSTMAQCRDVLLDAGVGEVICVALASAIQ